MGMIQVALHHLQAGGGNDPKEIIWKADVQIANYALRLIRLSLHVDRHRQVVDQAGILRRNGLGLLQQFLSPPAIAFTQSLISLLGQLLSPSRQFRRFRFGLISMFSSITSCISPSDHICTGPEGSRSASARIWAASKRS